MGLPEGLELLVATTTSPGRDQKVFFRNENGRTTVYSVIGSRKGGKKPSSDCIVEVDPSTILENPRSYSIPSNPGMARGLYLICSGHRIGLLCRRLTYMMRLDSSKPLRWLVQVVHLKRKPGIRTNFEEHFDQTEIQWVERRDLVAVYETEAMRARGNKQLDSVRTLYKPMHE
ncbi:hypothetical protein F5878DRAFT_614360 [Lentinula raphanica]|uniref:Uncharacterized protein n=1 Tax=Lentinula raphanica TaxID=153919 RepID=A0AA38PBW3_9AGAR|nr:hypothetical protein F5878DRAFT_614360 [Lentinula raphanica]